MERSTQLIHQLGVLILFLNKQGVEESTAICQREESLKPLAGNSVHLIGRRELAQTIQQRRVDGVVAGVLDVEETEQGFVGLSTGSVHSPPWSVHDRNRKGEEGGVSDLASTAATRANDEVR